MTLFERSPCKWWQKPLVLATEKHLPAELVVLAGQLRDGECGAWLNSRNISSGVIDLIPDGPGKFRSVRSPLPEFVRARLATIYSRMAVRKGIPDLVIWNVAEQSVRFVEVKCPDWDRLSAAQLRVHEICRSVGCEVSVEEWRFTDVQSRCRTPDAAP